MGSISLNNVSKEFIRPNGSKLHVLDRISFDAIGLQFCFGADADGMYVRDMFEISSLIDRFGNFGKPIHVTAVQTPSLVTPPTQKNPDKNAAAGGEWHHAWNEKIQARWLREFYTIALSKPFVETVSWRQLADDDQSHIPGGGLLREDKTPKPAADVLAEMRDAIVPKVS